MAGPPQRPKIYHILHVDRLPSIIADGVLWCDRSMRRRPGLGTMIGMSTVKQRRLSLPVLCHPGDYVGDYVPFYFCSRSVMLYLIHRGNHPELTYAGGQGPIVHLEADLHDVVAWADGVRRRWAFTLGNAGARYAAFRSNLDALGDINWAAIAARQWSGAGVSSDIKEGKQSEFLVRDSLPWHLVSRIGVVDARARSLAEQAVKNSSHRPKVTIRTDWYY